MVVSNEQIEKASAGMMKAMDEMCQMTNDSVSVMAQSASLMTKGYEEIYMNFSKMTKMLVENNIMATKAIWGAKSAKDAMEAQACAIKEQSDFVMRETTKLQEITARVTQEVMNPIAEHMNFTMSKATKMARAA